MMDLKKAILADFSKAQCDAIVRYIGDKQDRFDELVRLFLNEEYRVVQRAAWPLSYCAIAHPELIKKHIRKMILNLRKPGLPEAVKRNTVRFLQKIEIPHSLHGETMNTCFRLLCDPQEAVAVKVFSMTVLSKLARLYPEIIPEIKMTLEDQWPDQTAAFRNRAGKVIKELRIDSIRSPGK